MAPISPRRARRSSASAQATRTASQAAPTSRVTSSISRRMRQPFASSRAVRRASWASAPSSKWLPHPPSPRPSGAAQAPTVAVRPSACPCADDGRHRCQGRGGRGSSAWRQGKHGLTRAEAFGARPRVRGVPRAPLRPSGAPLPRGRRAFAVAGRRRRPADREALRRDREAITGVGSRRRGALARKPSSRWLRAPPRQRSVRLDHARQDLLPCLVVRGRTDYSFSCDRRRDGQTQSGVIGQPISGTVIVLDRLKPMNDLFVRQRMI